MYKEELKAWIENYIDNNPNCALEYKKLALQRMRSEERCNGTVLSGEIDESMPAKDLLVDTFLKRYPDIDLIEKYLQSLKSANEDRDFYIQGVFKDTKYSFLCSYDEYQDYLRMQSERAFSSSDGAMVEYSHETYQQVYNIQHGGLLNYDEYVKKGKAVRRELLKEHELRLQEALDFAKKGPEVIANIIAEEVEWDKFFRRNLAKSSVFEAFAGMGVDPAVHQEEIDRIITLHDAEAIESTVKSLRENPTENMLDLAKCIREAPTQSKGQMLFMKALDITHLAIGTILAALGIVSAAKGDFSWYQAAMGLGFLSLGTTSLSYHLTKTKKLKKIDALIPKCIEDFINAVEMEETFNKGL